MKTYIITMGLSLFLAGVVSAHHGVEIEHADKVFIKTGMGHNQKLKMMKCLLALKKYPNMDEAMTAVMAKIDDKCKTHNLSDKKCQFIKKHAAKGLVKCFTAKEFFQTFIGCKEGAGAAPAEATAPEAVPTAPGVPAPMPKPAEEVAPMGPTKPAEEVAPTGPAKPAEEVAPMGPTKAGEEVRPTEPTEASATTPAAAESPTVTNPAPVEPPKAAQ